MKKMFLNLALVSSIAISYSGCVQATPMTPTEVMNITKGDKFDPNYKAFFANYTYVCERLKPAEKEKMQIIWEKGTYSYLELYDYKNNGGLYGKRFEVKNLINNIDSFIVFEKREDCVKYAEPVPDRKTIDVYMH